METRLRECEVLGAADLDTLNTLEKSSGKLQQSKELLNIIATRTSGYEALIYALFESNQSGACDLLLAGYTTYNIPFSFETFGLQLSKEKLYDIPVSFQGKVVSLQCASNVLQVELAKIVEDLDIKTFLSMRTSPCPLVLVRDSVPPSLPFYIPRTLTCQNERDPSIFKMLPTDRFVFKGIVEDYELSNLVKDESTARSSTQLERLTHRLILLEIRNLKQIRKLSKVPIHLIQYSSGSLYLLRSYGNLRRAQMFLSKQVVSMSEEEFCFECWDNPERQTICISDTPGMGKTVLLSELARQIQCRSSDRLVIFSVFKDFTTNVMKRRGKLDAETIVRVLVSMVTENNYLSRKLVLNALLNKTKVQIDLFLDGFEELHRDMMLVSRQVLKCILKDMPNIQVYVTTRPHMRTEAESALESFAFSLRPFQFQEQVSFLVEYWYHRAARPVQYHSQRCQVIKNFAGSCLKAVKQNVADFDHEIAGVPLQCLLLAKGYYGSVKRYLNAPRSNVEIDISFRVSSIFEAYQQYVNDGMASVDKNNRKLAFYFHLHEAVKVLFPKYLKSAKETYKITNEIYAAGIVEAVPPSNDKYRFIHRTFAEFFVAKLFIQILQNKFLSSESAWFNKNPVSVLFSTALETIERDKVFCNNYIIPCFTFKNNAIAYFFECHLGKGILKPINMKNAQQIMATSASSSYKTTFKFYELVNACVSQNLEKTFEFICNIYLCNDSDSFLSRFTRTQFDWPLFILLATKYSNLELLKACERLVLQITGLALTELFTTYNEKLSPLDVSVSRGNYQVFEYLYKTFHPDPALFNNLFGLVVKNSIDDSQEVVNQKVRIMKYLLEKDKKLINKRYDTQDSPPILMPYIHIKILKALLKAGANAFAKDGSKTGNIAYQAASYLSVDDYHDLVKTLLVEEKRPKVFLAQNKEGETAIHKALFHLDLKEETLMLLSEYVNVKFNTSDKAGHTELYYAVQGRRKVAVLQAIIQYGGKWRKRNLRKESLLHRAAKVGNLPAIEFFIKKGIDVNSRDALGRTPLHSCLKSQVGNLYDIAYLLIVTYKADVSAVNIFGQTPLDLAKTLNIVDSRIPELLKIDDDKTDGKYTNNLCLYPWFSLCMNCLTLGYCCNACLKR